MELYTETIYHKSDLRNGVCKSCGEHSEEILIGDGRCIDCIEEQKFYEATMTNYHSKYNRNDERQPY